MRASSSDNCSIEPCGACINEKYVRQRDGFGRHTGGYQIEDPGNPGFSVHPLPNVIVA